MKGLELAHRFYLEHGAPMLHEQFPQLESLVAVGLCGSGSECFGYDDEISQDHDFEPGFCLFLPSEDKVDSRAAFALERAYAKLPKTFMGFTRSPLSPVGGNRHGVIRSSEFFQSKTGTTDGKLELHEWFYLPEQALAEATNGELFRDDLGEVTAVRRSLGYFPEDVRRKKLAGHLLLMGQAGQYNYPRCVSRGDSAAAQLAMGEFVKSALHALFLLNKRYLPYYKWSFRALRDLPQAYLTTPLEQLLYQQNTPFAAAQKQQTVQQICTTVLQFAAAQGLTSLSGDDAERHAYAVNNTVADPNLRNLHILHAV